MLVREAIYYNYNIKILYYNLIIKMSKVEFILRFDGASRGNPGHSSYGFVVYSLLDSFITDKNNILVVHSEGDYIGKATNNQAEYRALLEGVRWCKNSGLKNVRIEGDSELVINQVRGVWLVRDKTLKTYWINIVEDM
jgi:ribonuclease HI